MAVPYCHAVGDHNLMRDRNTPCSMICLRGTRYLSSMLSSLQWVVFCVICVCCASSGVAASGNLTSVTHTWTHNLTLCALNNTENATKRFQHVVEAFAVVPLVTHVVSLFFFTTASFLDAAAFGLASWYTFQGDAIVLCGLYGLCGAIALFIASWRAVLNCLAFRYACTRRTNFLLTDKGAVCPLQERYVVMQGSQAVLPGGQKVTPKAVILGGREAKSLNSITAEHWSP
ncbi:GP5 glycosylated envelope protein [African pouched rat arterivirus]|uniref:GP5 glycosylated envelope protein n=1 Tax=African pouched rat arterivirus TaxID=1965064 RepID=A0A0B5JQL0_9NIDO|nr:GP5 glycosylated envelope protein [African pouched rat arterivirus]AJG06163.1 GP5 glycosylated envelope protein [African pouched rat arterivirus]